MSWKGKRVFVTGAGGFIGSHLTRRLLKEGACVHVLLRQNSPPWRIKDLLDTLTVWKSDLSDLKALNSILPQCNPQVIFHLASLVDISRSWDLILPMIEHNIIGTANLFKALKQCKFEAFVYTGSSEEYGSADSPIQEDQRAFPISPYSFSKASSTLFCQMAAATFDLPVTVVRLFPTYGPLQEGSMFIPSAIRELLLKGEFKMSRGDQLREFNYVDDVVDALLKVALCRKANGEVINIGSGIPYKVKDVIAIIQGLIQGRADVHLGALPYRKGEAKECFCSNQKLKHLTGWSPGVSLQEGLKLTFKWYKSYLEQYKE